MSPNFRNPERQKFQCFFTVRQLVVPGPDRDPSLSFSLPVWLCLVSLVIKDEWEAYFPSFLLLSLSSFLAWSTLKICGVSAFRQGGLEISHTAEIANPPLCCNIFDPFWILIQVSSREPDWEKKVGSHGKKQKQSQEHCLHTCSLIYCKIKHSVTFH